MIDTLENFLRAKDNRFGGFLLWNQSLEFHKNVQLKSVSNGSSLC